MLLLFQFDMVFGFSWFCFVLFLKGLEVNPPPPTQWQMKPSVLLQSPPFVHLCPLPCSFPAAFTQFVYVSSAFRQLQHSDVGNVPDSCTLDQPTGLPAPSQQNPLPIYSPSLHENLVFGMFYDSWRASLPCHPHYGVMRKRRRIFNWFCVINFPLCFVLI